MKAIEISIEIDISISRKSDISSRNNKLAEYPRVEGSWGFEKELAGIAGGNPRGSGLNFRRFAGRLGRMNN